MTYAGVAADSGVKGLDTAACVAPVGYGSMGVVMGLTVYEEGARALRCGRQAARCRRFHAFRSGRRPIRWTSVATTARATVRSNPLPRTPGPFRGRGVSGCRSPVPPPDPGGASWRAPHPAYAPGHPCSGSPYYPAYHASGVNLAVVGMDFKVVVTEQRLKFLKSGQIGDESDTEIHCVVSMSLHTAKDFLFILGDAISKGVLKSYSSIA